MNSIQTFSSTEFGYTIALNDPPLPHVGPIVEAFRNLFGRPGGKLNLPEPRPTRAAGQRVLLNLSDSASPRINEARIEFLVEEGLWLYRLGSRASGWGCVEAGVQRARIMVVRVQEGSHYGEVLAEPTPTPLHPFGCGDAEEPEAGGEHPCRVVAQREPAAT